MAPIGRIICAGLGPGDPDLISVRSDRAIRAARHIAYFRKIGRQGQARRIVEGMLAPGAVEHAMEYPVTTEIPFDSPEYNALLAAFYDDWTARLQALAEAGQEVVVLCEGDPFFYGSFMHLYVRLKDLVQGPLGLLNEGDNLHLLPFFDLTRVHNYGVSLGMLTATAPEHIHSLNAAIGISAVYGLFSGVLNGRALRLLKVEEPRRLAELAAQAVLSELAS